MGLSASSPHQAKNTKASRAYQNTLTGNFMLIAE